MKISLIAGIGKNREMGIDGKMPWHISADFKHFKQTTMGHTMIMGRKTYDSIGKALPGRTTVVLTRNKDLKIEGVDVVHSKGEAYGLAHNNGETELFIVGGAQIYELFINDATDIYLSEIDYEGEADTFFPKIESDLWSKKKTTHYEATDKAPAWDMNHLVKA